MSHVTGPFIEYQCHNCKNPIKEAAPRNEKRLTDRIAELNADSAKRVCARCWQPA